VYRQFIGKRDDSQEAPAKLIHSALQTIPVIPLTLSTNGRANDSNAHLLGQIRSLAQDLIFKNMARTDSQARVAATSSQLCVVRAILKARLAP
jgi:hypothetical protein